MTGWLVLGGAAVVLAAAAVTVVLVRRRAAGPVPWRMSGLMVAAAATVLAGAADDRFWALGAFVLFPVALVLYPDDRPPRGLGWAAPATVAGAGLLAVVDTALYARSGLAGLVGFLLVLAVQWWRFEHAGPADRRALLWLGIGAVPAPMATLIVGFVAAPDPGSPTVMTAYAVTWLIFLTTLCVGLLAPQVRDVRAATVTVAVHLATGLLVVVVYVTVLSAIEVVAGHPVDLNPGAAGLIAAGCAAGYAPTARLLRLTMEVLLFGAHPDPLRAASQAGEQLTDDPVAALRSLRQALSLPYAALVDGGGRPVASSGKPPPVLVRQPLSAADPGQGHLEVGLRPAQQGLHRSDRQVLAVLTPALAQLMRARALREQVQASRTAVVAAVEEERRRLRRDLHDGLGPRLTGIAYAADAARNLVGRDPARTGELLAGLRAEAGEAITEIRQLVEELRPPSLDQVGLEQTLRQHVLHVLGPDGVPLSVELIVPDPLPPLGAAVEVTAYRIVVEALTNAARHSGGDRVTIDLQVADDELAVAVRDNGDRPGPWAPGVGLTSMRERAEMLGGRVTTHGGGLVEARIPLLP